MELYNNKLMLEGSIMKKKLIGIIVLFICLITIPLSSYAEGDEDASNIPGGSNIPVPSGTNPNIPPTNTGGVKPPAPAGRTTTPPAPTGGGGAAPTGAAGSGLGSMTSSFSDNFKSIYTFAIGIATLIFVILFLVGGIMYLTAAGNDESTKKARSLIVDAVIGLIIVLIAWSAGTWILSKLVTTGYVDTSSGQIVP
jgi:uncharacterized membrane protein